MKRYAINIELETSKGIRYVKQTIVPVDCEDVQSFLEEKYKGTKVLTFDEKLKGSTTNINDMGESERNGFLKEKNKCIEIAKDFFYPKEIFDRIEAAETAVQLDIIMKSAKNAYI